MFTCAILAVMIFTAEIPVKPYIKQYLEYNFGRPAHLTREKSIGKYLFELLERERRDRDKEYKGYTAVVTVRISEDIHIRHGSFLTKTNIINFNSFLEDHIKALMCIHVDAVIEGMTARDKKVKISEAIEMFQEKFGFTEQTFGFETIKKAYYRYRKEEEDKQNSNSLKMSA